MVYPGTYADLTPDRPAIVMVGSRETLTYAELEERSTRLARVFRVAGLRPGDSVALISENSPRCFEAYWAALRSGLYFTAVNHDLSADEVSAIVDDSGAQVLLVSSAHRELALAIVDDTPQVSLRLAFGGAVAGHGDYEAALTVVSAAPLGNQPRGADLLYSAGTTGRPKAVKPPLPNCQVDDPGGDPFLALFGPMYGFDSDTRFLSVAPLYHAAPLRLSGMVHAAGGTVHVVERFDPVETLRSIGELGITHSQWAPTMFVRMLKLPAVIRAGVDVSTLRVAIHAAAPCPIGIKRAMIDWWGPILFEYYASTEGNGITFIDSAQWLAKPGSVGRAGLGVVRICDDLGGELSPGEVGLVYFERAVLPFVYHNDPDLTRSVQHPQHPTWTTNGDLGHLDADGYLFLADRSAFVVRHAGADVYPQQVESTLILHPGVLDVAVLGVPDHDAADSLLALVQPTPGFAPSGELESALVGFLRGRMPQLAMPVRVEIVDSLPRTPTGKMLKGVLRERHALQPLASG